MYGHLTPLGLGNFNPIGCVEYWYLALGDIHIGRVPYPKVVGYYFAPAL